LRRLTDVLDRLPSGSPVLLDGLIASSGAPSIARTARSRPVVVLVHMPFGQRSAAGLSADGVAEGAVLRAAHAVVTTSTWTRARLVELYRLPPARVCVAEPGADPAPAAPFRPNGRALLCLAAVAPHKGQDVLVDALARLRELPWTCVCAGSLDVDPDYAQAMRARAAQAGITDRLQFAGPVADAEVAGAYAAADVVVAPSRIESYGLVVTEALARGIPVIATSAGGIPEALGSTADGQRPGLLVAPDDPDAFAAALRSWLEGPDLRLRLREAVLLRRRSLPTWASTARRVAEVVARTAAACSVPR
jgi:glycosyltransferase involved in cell wall biosynthesis